MFHSNFLCASLLLLIATPVCAQVIVVPPGAPLPNFQPGMNYQFPAGYPMPPGGWQVPSGNIGISVGGMNISVTATQQSIYGAAQDAARAAAARGEGVPNFQFLIPLDGLNVNVLQGGVALPADVGTPTLIQSGSSLMIGSTPPVVGGGGSAKPATDADGNKSSESKSADRDGKTTENEKEHSTHTASFGKDSSSGKDSSTEFNANVSPPPTPGATGGGTGVPPDKNAPKDPTPTPKVGKPGDPRPTGKPRTVVAAPIDVRTWDPVAERIDQGLERDIGVTPPIMHQINSVGVSVPECMGASREGLACD